MKSLQDRLFTEGDLSNITLTQPQTVAREIDKLTKQDLLTHSQEQIVTATVTALTIDPLEVDESRMARDAHETDVDVSGDPIRFTHGDGPCLVSGTQLVVDIPFRGDTQLWRYRPNGFYIAPLPYGRVANSGNNAGVVKMIFEFPNDESPDRVKRRIDDNLQYLRQCLSAQKQIILKYNSTLPKAVRDALQVRMANVQRQNSILDSLGIPPKKDTSVAPPSADPVLLMQPVPSTPVQRETVKTDLVAPSAGANWDVFISHASEDKDSFVRALATKLTAKGLRVWYDEFTLTIGDSLRGSIDIGLARSRFGIVVLSHSFFSKDWPQKELDGLVAKEKATHKVILPIWHGVTKDDVAKCSPILADRLAVSTTKGIDSVIAEILRATDHART